MGEDVVKTLVERGVQMPNPGAVTVGEEVDPARISADGVVIFPGCRIAGADTWISANARLGSGGPVILENCRLGPDTELASGVFQDVVFMGKNRIGPGAHFRKGTILEESAGAAHSVGLKETVLFPFVTLGSLINFCDCLMAGGTGPQDHSEVGSSFIHFNFTPNQDKATPSLLGDVPRGVMLDRPPIFLGGQGGLVGPCRVAFGTVTASGTILRKDVIDEGRLVFEAPRRSFSVPNVPGLYRNIQKIVENNLIYMANLKALEAWYRHFRILFSPGSMPPGLLDGLQAALAENLRERIGRMTQFVGKLPESIAIYRKVMGDQTDSKVISDKKQLVQRWPAAADILQRPAADFESARLRESFLTAARSALDTNSTYTAAVSGLPPETRTLGTAWLQDVVDRTVAGVRSVLNADASAADKTDVGGGSENGR